jgi:hypothetical protein
MRWLKHCLACCCACTVLACGEEPPAPLDTAGELWCDGLCRATRSCGDPRTQGSCRSACAAERPGLESYSVPGAKLLGSCLGRLTCQETYNPAEWETATDACWQNARRAVEPTARVRSFCAGYSETWFECNRWLSTAECESIFGMWADTVIDRLTACELRPTCDELESCVTTTFETL